MYLLDTNICIYFLNNKSENIVNKLTNIHPNKIFLCSVVKAELLYGAFKSRNPEKTQILLREFCNQFASVPFDDFAALHQGNIRSELEKKGKIIGPNDLMIAAIALSQNLILVTHNHKEFNRIDNLKLEDWS